MNLAAYSLAQLEVEGYGTFVAAAGLELDRIALVQILELDARREAAAMKKDVVAAVVGNDEAKPLISDNFFYRSGHIRHSLSFGPRPRVSYSVFQKPARSWQKRRFNTVLDSFPPFIHTELMPVKKVIVAQPRGFCAGVEMAIETVERALKKYGPPLYVFHEIVHNRHVVQDFTQRGVAFVQSVDEVPAGAKLIFSAHGVAPAVVQQARERGVEIVIDATCPLVEKVHREVRKFSAQGYGIILVGHEDHDEIVGTSGEAPERIQIVATVEEAEKVTV